MTNRKARNILEIYTYFKGQPGHVLISNQFLAVGRRQNWSAVELQDGIAEAHRIGWIEPAERGWRLTQEGFFESERALHA